MQWDDWGAWQGIGSTVAILAAIGLAWHQGALTRKLAAEQHRQNKELERDREAAELKRRMDALGAITDHAFELVERSADVIQVERPDHWCRQVASPLQLDAATRALHGVPLHELPHYELVRGVTHMADAIRRMRRVVDSLAQAGRTGKPGNVDLVLTRGAAADAVCVALQARTEVEQAMKELGQA